MIKSQLLYLTFDDGPTHGVTDKVLELLDQYNAKATFFCLGKNIVEQAELFQNTKQLGHTVANHSYSHPNGWKTSTRNYLEDIKKAQKFFNNSLFRPPYGKISPRQYWLVKKEFKIVFWNILSRDYKVNYSAEKCFKYVVKAQSGDIIVFHDSLKAKERMLPCLEMTLKYFSEKGFVFLPIQE